MPKVKLKDLRNPLPDNAPVVTAEERAAQIRLHRQAYQFPRRWEKPFSTDCFIKSADFQEK